MNPLAASKQSHRYVSRENAAPEGGRAREGVMPSMHFGIASLDNSFAD
jgi:hypothetical protein